MENIKRLQKNGLSEGLLAICYSLLQRLPPPPRLVGVSVGYNSCRTYLRWIAAGLRLTVHVPHVSQVYQVWGKLPKNCLFGHLAYIMIVAEHSATVCYYIGKCQ